MPHHDDAVSLRQMLDHAREASALVKQRVRADLDRERVLTLALVQYGLLTDVLGRLVGVVTAAGRGTEVASAGTFSWGGIYITPARKQFPAGGDLWSAGLQHRFPFFFFLASALVRPGQKGKKAKRC